MAAESVSKETEIGLPPVPDSGSDVTQGSAAQLEAMIGLRRAFNAIPAARQDELFADFSAAARSRDMNRLLDSITRWAGISWVPTVPDAVRDHPLEALIGKYEDEPLWEDLLAAMAQYRREVDEQQENEVK